MHAETSTASGTPSTPPPKAPDSFLSSVSLADFLDVSLRTVQGWRATGEGPPYKVMSNRSIRYQVQAVLDWLDERDAEARG